MLLASWYWRLAIGCCLLAINCKLLADRFQLLAYSLIPDTCVMCPDFYLVFCPDTCVLILVS